MPSRPPPLSTPHSLHTHLLSFLTLSIHTILHARGLYPASTFLLTRAFNFPVPQNRHPQLCAYINSCISSLTPYLQSGNLSSVSIVIYSPSSSSSSSSPSHPSLPHPPSPSPSSSPSSSPNNPPSSYSSSPSTKNPNPTTSPPQIHILERYIFNLSRIPPLPATESLTTIESRGPGDPSEIKLIDVEEELRAILRALAYSASKLEDLQRGEECTWGVVLELKDEDGNETNALDGNGLGSGKGKGIQMIGDRKFEPAIAELQIPANTKREAGSRKGKEREGEGKGGERAGSRVGKDRGGMRSIPIRAVEVGEFIMEAWIEEGRAKFAGEHEK